MPFYRVLIHREYAYFVDSPDVALDVAISDLTDNLSDSLTKDGNGGFTSANADVTIIDQVEFKRITNSPPVYFGFKGPSGNCAECGLALGVEPDYLLSNGEPNPVLIDDDGTDAGASWWWDFDPGDEDTGYCARHTRDSTEPEAFTIMRGD